MIRIIPKLEIKGPNIVKGVQLEGLRVLGKPSDFARYYYQNGADELIYQDVVASLYGRNSLKDIIEETAKEIFVPLTVGGGIRTIEDIENVLSFGADKVSINTMAINNPKLIEEAAKTFGCSTIVVAIEYLQVSNDNYLIFTDNGREHTGKNVFEWLKEIQDLGAGEIILTSIEKDGKGKGFDIEFINKIKNDIRVPLIVNGGAGDINDIEEIYRIGNVDGIALGSILHYSLAKKQSYQDSHFEKEGNINFLKNKSAYNKFGNESIKSIKEKLTLQGLECRI